MIREDSVVVVIGIIDMHREGRMNKDNTEIGNKDMKAEKKALSRIISEMHFEMVKILYTLSMGKDLNFDEAKHKYMKLCEETFDEIHENRQEE
jgi:hypothetical protein